MTENEYMFVTGRLVQGNVFEPQTKNREGGPLIDRQGNPKIQYFVGVAVEKTDAAMMETWARIQQIGHNSWPGGESRQDDFAWKVIDGDDPKHVGKTGFPGCLIFRFSSGFPVKAYTQGAASQIVDPNQIKRGYYIRVAFTVKSNQSTSKPGVFLNISLVELVGYGEEISGGPDASVVFNGAGAAPLPAGASTSPVAGGPPLAPAPPMPPETIVPAPDFLTPPVMTAKAGDVSFQQFIDQGWTKEALIQQGYLKA